MARRQRVDSITAQVEVMKAALQNFEPPAHVPLTEADLPFWVSITAEKPKSEWTAHDLELAALLAAAMRKMGEQEALLDTEGAVIATSSGNAAQNPRCRVVADLHARVIKYRQSLGIHNRAKSGEPRDVAKRRSQAFGVEAANPLDDDLLAKPNLH